MEIRTVATMEDIKLCQHLLLQYQNDLGAEDLPLLMTSLIQKDQLYFVYLYDFEAKVAAAFGTYRHLRKLTKGPVIVMEDLYTCPKYRSKGCARLLLDYVKNIAVQGGLQSVFLETDLPIHPSYSLYLEDGVDPMRNRCTMTISWENPQKKI